MERGWRDIGGGTWALAGLWAALLVGAPLFLAGARREMEDMGCFAVGHEAATPFAMHRNLGTRGMALPLPTRIALAIPVAVWLILAAAVPALLVWKTRRLPRGAAEVVDILAAVGLVATFGFLLAARMIPLS